MAAEGGGAEERAPTPEPLPRGPSPWGSPRASPSPRANPSPRAPLEKGGEEVDADLGAALRLRQVVREGEEAPKKVRQPPGQLRGGLTWQQQEAKRYVEENGLESMITGMMNEILVEQPENPRLAIFRGIYAKLSKEERAIVQENMLNPPPEEKPHRYLKKTTQPPAAAGANSATNGPTLAAASSLRSPRDEGEDPTEFLDPTVSLTFGSRTLGGTENAEEAAA